MPLVGSCPRAPGLLGRSEDTVLGTRSGALSFTPWLMHFGPFLMIRVLIPGLSPRNKRSVEMLGGKGESSWNGVGKHLVCSFLDFGS